MSSYIFISSNRDAYPVLIDDIIRLEACNGRTYIITSDFKQHIYSYNLREAEKLLNEHFFRSHDSHIINLKYIRKIARGRSYTVTMACKSLVPVAVRNVAEFRRRYYR